MKHFSLSEFNCPCCGNNEMDKKFLRKLDKSADISGVPYIINSGYRCYSHNIEVGSTSINHVSGKAADIKATDSVMRGKILKGLYKAGFKRIGIRKDFIHVDDMDSIESCWLYENKKELKK